LLAFTSVTVASLYFTRPYPDAISRASFATAYPALLLLAATLLIGPWNLFRKKPNPVSNDLRRDLGIWAGAVSILHAVIGQFVHLRGRPWLYYVYGSNEHHSLPVRHDLFGAANYTGAAAFLILAALLATSNDYSLRALRVPQWKRLQRWNYAVFALTAVHAVGYLLIEKQKASFVALVVSTLAIVTVFQAMGYVIRRALKKRNLLTESGGGSTPCEDRKLKLEARS
jgi:methionine sulfoxide reductase heme-binding subunit